MCILFLCIYNFESRAHALAIIQPECTEGKQAITHLCLSDLATGIAASIHLDNLYEILFHRTPLVHMANLMGFEMARYLACGEKTYE